RPQRGDVAGGDPGRPGANGGWHLPGHFTLRRDDFHRNAVRYQQPCRRHRVRVPRRHPDHVCGQRLRAAQGLQGRRCGARRLERPDRGFRGFAGRRLHRGEVVAWLHPHPHLHPVRDLPHRLRCGPADMAAVRRLRHPCCACRAVVVDAVTPLHALIEALEHDAGLRQPQSLHQRLDALDRLELLASAESDAGQAELGQRLVRVQEDFDALNAALYAQLRPPGTAITTLPPDMVAYQPTPARHILALLAQTQLTADDVLLDFGSGLGHVPLLTSICTGAAAIGIECEPAYVDCARAGAHALQLSNVQFHCQDARAADLAPATLLYLYTPFV